MLIRTRNLHDPLPSEITPRPLFEQRRRLIQAAGLGSLLVLAGSPPAFAAGRFDGAAKSPLSSDEKPNSLRDITTYNTFYEFGTDKGDPAKTAGRLKTRPWTVSVEGLVKKPKVFAIDDLLSQFPLEERIYRLRCVEGWSMVVPWVGFPLASLLKQVEPLGSAKFVEFVTHVDRKDMPGLAVASLDWPYVDCLLYTSRGV